jgi:hypothetical protein
MFRFALQDRPYAISSTRLDDGDDGDEPTGALRVNFIVREVELLKWEGKSSTWKRIGANAQCKLFPLELRDKVHWAATFGPDESADAEKFVKIISVAWGLGQTTPADLILQSDQRLLEDGRVQSTEEDELTGRVRDDEISIGPHWGAQSGLSIHALPRHLVQLP